MASWVKFTNWVMGLFIWCLWPASTSMLLLVYCSMLLLILPSLGSRPAFFIFYWRSVINARHTRACDERATKTLLWPFSKTRLGLELGLRLRQLFGKCALYLRGINQVDRAQAQAVILKKAYLGLVGTTGGRKYTEPGLPAQARFVYSPME